MDPSISKLEQDSLKQKSIIRAMMDTSSDRLTIRVKQGQGYSKEAIELPIRKEVCLVTIYPSCYCRVSF